MFTFNQLILTWQFVKLILFVFYYQIIIIKFFFFTFLYQFFYNSNEFSIYLSFNQIFIRKSLVLWSEMCWPGGRPFVLPLNFCFQVNLAEIVAILFSFYSLCFWEELNHQFLWLCCAWGLCVCPLLTHRVIGILSKVLNSFCHSNRNWFQYLAQNWFYDSVWAQICAFGGKTTEI